MGEAQEKTYIAIDLKSFYASVECVKRGLDPLATNLVVADLSRTEKTICLAVSPSLKSFGIPGRARLFELIQRVREVNDERQKAAPGKRLSGKSSHYPDLLEHPDWAVDYLIARPQMARYMECSTRIYQVYLNYVAPEDIHVYSVDEVFIDATKYLPLYQLSAHDFAMKLILEVLRTTGITATAGIGTNLYLAKIAMDIEAKHITADENGVRIAALNELTYRQKLWNHRPLTDFWRLGKGYARKLELQGLRTMGDIARFSLRHEDVLYDLFGINAELLIDHAWGWEPCTMADIKAYRPETHSLSSGQVLSTPYPFDKAQLVIREMADFLSLDLVRKGLVTDQLVLTLGYDRENLTNPEIAGHYQGPVEIDRYGRKIPRQAHGSWNLMEYTASTEEIMKAAAELFERIVEPSLLVRRMYLVANHVIPLSEKPERQEPLQLDFFTDYAALEAEEAARDEKREKESRMQQTILELRERYGTNAVLRGMNLQEGATAKERNRMIGGHKA